MSKWNKETFIEDLRAKCSRETAKIAERIIEFSEQHADEITWGRGHDHGTMTFRCESDFGVLSLFHLTSEGQLNLQVNYLRSKELPKQVMRDMIVKLEANFLRDYDEMNYPVDSYVPIEELFHTYSQVEKFLSTIEGCVYRLKQ
jgi:hypothetical protein